VDRAALEGFCAFLNCSIYIAGLERLRKEAEKQSIYAQSHADLHARFLAWFNSLPEVSRCRPFAMIEIEKALYTQGKYISPILLCEGWQRKRKWSSKSQYHRYWIPPCWSEG
jgi:hypothetical protein